MEGEDDAVESMPDELGEIAAPSYMSLRIQLWFGDKNLADATGFLVERQGVAYLITNRHNLRGRRNDSNEAMSQYAAIPDAVEISHNSVAALGKWEPRREVLYDDKYPRWLEHPELGDAVDVVALPLSETEGVDMYPYDIWSPSAPIRVAPSESVSVIGFPFSLTAGLNFAVWIQGAIASEPTLDWNRQPVFLVDSRTRPGSSGSPVIAYRPGVRQYEDGRIVTGDTELRFLGVYSGRVSSDSDLGLVWKEHVVREIIDGGVHPARDLDAPD